MSSGNGTAGSTAEYVRDAQDVTRRLKRRLTYLNFTNDGGAPRYTTDNGNESYLSFLFGRANCAGCTGLPFQERYVRSFR